jgi:hypothetical protein
MGCKCNENIVKHIEKKFGVTVFSLEVCCFKCDTYSKQKKNVPKGKTAKWFMNHQEEWKEYIKEYRAKALRRQNK